MAGRGDGSAGPKPDAPASAAASFRYPPAPAAARASREETVLLASHPPLGEDDDDEPTFARTFELGDGPTDRRARPPAEPPHEETARLEGSDLGASDSGWGTVVLPGGGYPAHAEDRTQVLAVDEPRAAVSVTTMISVSLGAPDPVDPVGTARLPGMGGSRVTEPPTSRSPLAAAISIPMPSRGPAGPPGDWTVPTAIAAAIPAAGAPVVPRASVATAPSVAYPVISGPYPIVGPTPTGGVPVVPRSGPRGNGRRGAVAPAATGAHPNLRAAANDNTRLAWGFLVGVLITVATLAAAIALSLLLLR